jgi:hypothetical protein
MTDDRLIRVVRAVQTGVRWLKESTDEAHEPSATAVTVSAQYSRSLAPAVGPEQSAAMQLSDQLRRPDKASRSWIRSSVISLAG